MTMDNFRFRPIVCVDFDGTIVDEGDWPCDPQVKPGAKEAMIALRDMGFFIKIYSARNNPIIRDQPKRFQQMVTLLRQYEIPYDDIELQPKPMATLYIDDRAIGFKNWEQVMEDVQTKLSNG